MGERWLVTGGTGQLGGHLLRLLRADSAVASVGSLGRSEASQPASADFGNAGNAPQMPDVRAVGENGSAAGNRDAPLVRFTANLADLDRVVAAVAEFAPTHVIHTAGMTGVGECHADPARSSRINTEATTALAQAATAGGARFVFTSTDMVFDGCHAPYDESATPQPLSHYGRTKAAAEVTVSALSSALVVRIPLLIGLPCNARKTTFADQLDALRAGRPLTLFHDEHRTPLWVEDAARFLIVLARSDVRGIIHLAGPERLSRLDIVARVAARLGIGESGIVPVSRTSIAGAEPRPADLSLNANYSRSLFPALRARSIDEIPLVEEDGD